MGRGGPDIMMRKCAGNACVLPQHVQCESARRATGKGAPSPQARGADPPHFERARAAARAVELEALGYP